MMIKSPEPEPEPPHVYYRLNIWEDAVDARNGWFVPFTKILWVGEKEYRRSLRKYSKEQRG